MLYTTFVHLWQLCCARLFTLYIRLKSAAEWNAMFLIIGLVFLLMISAADARGTPTTYTLNVSAYSSTPGQTDSTPNITATGTVTRPGVLAVSRNLLGKGNLPYGTRVRAVSQRGCGLNVVGRVFIVEDTMASRMYNKADIWMPSTRSARKFGRCMVSFQKI